MFGEQNSPPNSNPSPGAYVEKQGWLKGRAGWFLISAPPHRGQIPEEKRAEGELGLTRARVLNRSLEQDVERKRKVSCLTQAPGPLTPLFAYWRQLESMLCHFPWNCWGQDAACPVEHPGGLTHSRRHTCVHAGKDQSPDPTTWLSVAWDSLETHFPSRHRKGATFHLPLELHQGQERRSNYTC